MSLALVHSRARAGMDAPAVRVEVHLSGGLPAIQIVGLPEAAVRESRDRVRAAWASWPPVGRSRWTRWPAMNSLANWP